MRYSVQLSLDAPAIGYISLEELHDYIKEAIEIWGGHLHPDSDFFYSTTVKQIKTRNYKTVYKN